MGKRDGKSGGSISFIKRLRIPIVLSLCVIVAAIKTLPGSGAPSSVTSGDPQLLAQLTPLLIGARDRVSAVLIDPTGIRYAFWGAALDTQYEIGSITKTFTAALLADSVARGEITLDKPLGEILPVGASPVGEVSLKELVTHHAGLASMPTGWHEWIVTLTAVLRHRDPLFADDAQLLTQAETDPLSSRGQFAYSNKGFALLGNALATWLNRRYVDLLNERLLIPAGMMQTTLPETVRDLPQDFTTGYSTGGFHEGPWTLGAYAPAGSMRSTIVDMARYARLLLDGRFPGAAALKPLSEAEHSQIGMAWFISRVGERDITWHNGSTGGFSSIIMLDRQAGKAVVILSNTAYPLEDAALNVLIPPG